ncbi:MAG: flippase-like domain-containing protein [Bacteroidetes bacterium]|nr:flippase-like domain-containing protein [Bacteroidota bacterium]MBT3748164.1 flippase-like domain-containing protein [Bacteroidota bacterium]MBT4400010.1 flippase-like domain-containing protein [Bacteroidota bacterium]MBT4409601.1 flippase-like domain-containing protein [Bacteroidota bacterium]MBT5426801.1 flippase-like domain-containing protein [Bacteroidota bacterium]
MSKRIQTLVKILITLATFGYIAWKLMRYEDLGSTGQLFIRQLGEAPVLLLVLAILMMPLNWLLEMKKWKNLICFLHPISWAETIRAVLAGLTMALLTPNRIGETFSRVFVLPKEQRVAGVGLSTVNSLAQIVIIQLFGVLGILILLNNELFLETTRTNIGWTILVLGALISVLIVIIFFRIDKIGKVFGRWKRIKKFTDSINIINRLSYKHKWTVLFWSGLKYFVYTTQFYLLLVYFGVDIPWYTCYPAMMTIYILLNYMPVIAIGEAGIRGSVTLFIIGQFSEATISILAASFGLWLLNIVIPAIIGGFIMPKVKF